MPHPSAQQFVKNLKQQLSPEQVLSSQVDLKLYDTDATALFKNQALAITLPRTADEISTIIKLINQARKTYPELNFVARGAGTGLSGGAIGNEHSVIISLANLTRIINIDTENRSALIETGVINADISKHSCDHRLHFAPDPSSQAACTIGGNIAENAGGIHCYKYGVTSDHILGLEVVMPDGEIVYLGAMPRHCERSEAIPTTRHCNESDATPEPRHCERSEAIHNPHFTRANIDLAKLFTGSEGTFGIATKALVRLIRIPESFITMQVSLASVQDAAEIVASIIRAGFTPAALEMIDAVAIAAVNKAYNLGINCVPIPSLQVQAETTPSTVNAILLIELDGDNDEILLEANKIKNIINEYQVLNYEETQDPKRKQELWKVRKGVAAAFGQIAPYWYLYDAVVPRSKIPKALKQIQAIADKHQLLQAGMAHAADGNLHPNFLYDPDKDPTVVERIFKASHEIMQLCVDLGGTLSGEHGIGLEKREYMDYLWSPEDMQAMLKVRKAFDPELIANPDKLFPIRICKENLGHCKEHIR